MFLLHHLMDHEPTLYSPIGDSPIPHYSPPLPHPPFKDVMTPRVIVHSPTPCLHFSKQKFGEKTALQFPIESTLTGGVRTDIAPNIFHPRAPGAHRAHRWPHNPCAFTPLRAIAVSTPLGRLHYIRNCRGLFLELHPRKILSHLRSRVQSSPPPDDTLKCSWSSRHPRA